MRKGTFSVENSKAHSSKHNSRKIQPKYLIDSSQKNYYELIITDNEFISEAQNRYKQIIKQNMQKKQIPSLIKETVLTIHEHQNEHDIKSLFKELNKEFGGHYLTELSIHRDEGYFLKDEIAYYPTKNILNKNGSWYICSNANIDKPKKDDFDKKVNIKDFEKVFNYHAHAKFSMFDMKTAKTSRMKKKDMSKRIKFVSDYLNLDYNPGVNRYVKKSVNQVKDEHLVRARVKEKNQKLANQNDLKEEIKILREKLKENKAIRQDYSKLEQLNKDLKLQIKNKALNKGQLEQKIKALEIEILKQKKEKEHFKALNEEKGIEVIELKNQNKALIKQKNTLDDKNIELKKKINSRPIMSDYEYEINNNKELNKDIETLNKYLLKNYQNFNNNSKLSIFRQCVNFLMSKIDEMKDKIFNLIKENEKLKQENINIKKEYVNQFSINTKKIIEENSKNFENSKHKFRRKRDKKD